MALTLACSVVLGCPSGDVGQVPAPALERWPLTELDGEIRSQFGGRPVLCLQGAIERRPAPLYSGPAPVRSWLELRPGGALDFAFYFEDGSEYDVVSTDPELASVGFLDEAFGSGALRRAASWSWDDRTVEGVVESLPGDGDLRARFTVRGSFEEQDRIAGRWTFQASSETGSCWGRSMGRGSFRAGTE